MFTLCLEWERLWATYVTKLQRLDELRTQGRYGYQLKQPKRAIRIAAAAIRAFDAKYDQHVLNYRSGVENGGAVAWE